MSMLAEKKKRQKWSLNPRGTAWLNDKNKFGQKILENMGWSPGEGLGAQKQGIKENLKTRVKSDTAGLGFKNNSEEWLKQQSEFSDLLANLSGSNTEVEDDDVSTSAGRNSLELKSKQSRARVHCHEFADGKDHSERSSKDLVIRPDSVNGGALSQNSEVSATLNNCDIEKTGSKDSMSLEDVYCADDRTQYSGKKTKTRNSTHSVMEADSVFQASINSVDSNHDSKKKRKNKQNLSVNDSEVSLADDSEPKPDKKKKKKQKTATDDNKISVVRNQVVTECVIHNILVSSLSKKKKLHSVKSPSLEEYEGNSVDDNMHSSVQKNEDKNWEHLQTELNVETSIVSVNNKHSEKKKKSKDKQNPSVNDSEVNIDNNSDRALLSDGSCPLESHSNGEALPDKKKKKKRKLQIDDNENSLYKKQVDTDCVIDDNLDRSSSKKKKQHNIKHTLEEYEGNSIDDNNMQSFAKKTKDKKWKQLQPKLDVETSSISVNNQHSEKKKKSKHNLSISENDGHYPDENGTIFKSEENTYLENNSDSVAVLDKKKRKKLNVDNIETNQNENLLSENVTNSESCVEDNVDVSSSKQKKHMLEQDIEHSTEDIGKNISGSVDGDRAIATESGGMNRKGKPPPLVKRKLRGIMIVSSRYQEYIAGQSSQTTDNINELYNKFVMKNFCKPTECEDSNAVEKTTENTCEAGTMASGSQIDQSSQNSDFPTTNNESRNVHGRKFGPEYGRKFGNKGIIGRLHNNRLTDIRSRTGRNRFMGLSRFSRVIRKPTRFGWKSKGLDTISGMNSYLKSLDKNTILKTVLNFAGANLGNVEGYPTWKQKRSRNFGYNRNNFKCEESCTAESQSGSTPLSGEMKRQHIQFENTGTESSAEMRELEGKEHEQNKRGDELNNTNERKDLDFVGENAQNTFASEMTGCRQANKSHMMRGGHRGVNQNRKMQNHQNTGFVTPRQRSVANRYRPHVFQRMQRGTAVISSVHRNHQVGRFPRNGGYFVPHNTINKFVTTNFSSSRHSTRDGNYKWNARLGMMRGSDRRINNDFKTKYQQHGSKMQELSSAANCYQRKPYRGTVINSDRYAKYCTK